jgi:hypothetical protein
MANNPFDYGGALTSGIEGGARAGAILGRRFREGQIKRAARKAYDLDSQLMDMGILDENGEVIPNAANDEKAQALLAERDKRLTYLADKAADMDSRGWEGQAQAGLALSRYNPLANSRRAKTGTESLVDTAKGIPDRMSAEAAPPTDGATPTPAPAVPTGDSPLPASVQAKPTAPDMFAPENAQLNQLRRVSQITGRAMVSPEQENELRVRAVNYYGGNILALVAGPMEEARKRASTVDGDARATIEKEFLPLSPDQQDTLVANLQNAIIYTPALKGAVVEQKDGQVWIDPDGGGAAKAHPVNTLEGMDNLRKLLDTYSKGTVNLLERTRGEEAAAAKAQMERTDKANEFVGEAIKKVPEFFNKSGLSAEAFISGSRNLESEWKSENAADYGENFAAIASPQDGEVLVNVRTSKDGRILYTSRVSADKDSTGVPRTIYRDDAGNILEGDALKEYTGAGNGEFLLSVARGYNALADANAAAYIDMAVGHAGAVAQGAVSRPRWNPQSSTGAGGVPTDKGARDESGFPTANRGNNAGARNLNPLNLKSTSGEFRQFGSVEEGFDAAANQLMRYYEGKGVAEYPRRNLTDIITLWAPPEDKNNTAKYTQDVASWMGVDPNQELNLKDPAVMRTLMEAMAYKETMWRNPTGNSQDAGTQMARRTAVPARPTSVAQVGDNAPDESGKKMQLAGQSKGIFPMAFAEGGNVVIPPDLFNFLKAD